MIITYCRACHDKYRVGDLVHGYCCGYPLITREATELEEKDCKAKAAAVCNKAREEGLTW